MRTLSSGQFTLFGLSHWVVLGLFVAGAVVAVLIGRGQRTMPQPPQFSRVVAAVGLVLQLAGWAYLLLGPPRDLRHALPLQLSDLAGLAATYAMWSHRHWAFSLTYFWGLTLSVQPLVTPALQLDFPDVQFLLFWGNHLFVVWAALYLTWGLGIRPNWSGYRAVVLITIGWAVAAFCLNVVLDTNYGYLNRKPPVGSVLDLFGDWPWYLIPEIGLVLGAWALMTWPWTRRVSQPDPGTGPPRH